MEDPTLAALTPAQVFALVQQVQQEEREKQEEREERQQERGSHPDSHQGSLRDPKRLADLAKAPPEDPTRQLWATVAPLAKRSSSSSSPSPSPASSPAPALAPLPAPSRHRKFASAGAHPRARHIQLAILSGYFTDEQIAETYSLPPNYPLTADSIARYRGKLRRVIATTEHRRELLWMQMIDTGLQSLMAEVDEARKLALAMEEKAQRGEDSRIIPGQGLTSFGELFDRTLRALEFRRKLLKLDTPGPAKDSPVEVRGQWANGDAHPQLQAGEVSLGAGIRGLLGAGAAGAGAGPGSPAASLTINLSQVMALPRLPGVDSGPLSPPASVTLEAHAEKPGLEAAPAASLINAPGESGAPPTPPESSE